MRGDPSRHDDAICAYSVLVKDLQRILRVLMHTIEGMPARGSELMTVKK